MAVLNATDADIRAGLSAQGVVVLDVWKDDCLPCSKLAPIIEELAAQFPDVTFLKLNINEAPATAAALRVDRFPMVFILKDGVKQTYFGGWMPAMVIADMIRDVL